MDVSALKLLFPSPFGVHVLKSDTYAIEDYVKIRFRPLSGFTF